MRFTMIMTLLSLSLGCNGDKADTGTDTDETAFAPMEGDWSWSNISYTTDDCSFETDFPAAVVEAFVWTLSWTDEGYELVAVGGDPLSCTLSDMDSTCVGSLVTEIDEMPSDSEVDPDVTVTLAITMDGTYTDETTASGTASVDATCEGADCEAYLADNGVSSPCNTIVAGDFTMGQ